ncbi:unnamed protein product [Vitrella brassicaformis CCMP3155]|uniref:Coatomer subunit gamma n=1 Tax=Vitrella brassicaformis (strain CCMP3155) TaxID=1169540 RepID=A0A0G4FMB9_VITBC|nr:unnamed protein product [Vitrella brassicaformis CCMP3155]|mmetsp:Transcript_37041/g.106024  ORF Transcript_37041/g.106024 Transcript_37041/m.106024 type:complete len:923 (+) Transcript_37041:51-2819(+)|eukprot:CEM15171.1 unnamed protein product [Vitrella brassicaformis CCMP3155]
MNAQTIREKITAAVKENFKSEEKPFVNPYAGEKSTVLLETRAFSEPHLNAKKCCHLLTKVLYLITQGEKLSSKETTDLFFGATKLFQSSSERLRRMTYLLIKSIKVSETEVFIVTSTLTKDMSSKSDCYRANAIRVLSRILDPSMAAQIDRYLKNAIVDKSPFVASAAIICGINLMRSAPEVVRRWVNEVTESVSSKSPMVQFHALGLLYELKRNDRLALHKVVSQLTKSFGKSPMAECLLIRYATQVLKAERDSALEHALMDYLESCLRHKSEMAMFEAAKAFCELAVVDEQGSGGATVFGYDMLPALTVLQIFLTSPKPVVRFASIRMLNKLAQVRPHVVSRCNVDMEPLLTDQNRNIATLALTTLLKTGHESNVDRLIKQITTFMTEISDNFKVEVVRAVKTLCLTYPSKYKVLMAFLSSNLREEGSAEFKKDIVDALILLVEQIPQAKETGLLHLCEFIEDCEYPSLCTKILSFLGNETPTTSSPSKFIRFIYNRLILENALVRAAGVDALTKIALKCPTLKKDILTLLESCTTDNDDEVRDRTNLYCNMLEGKMGGKDGDLLVEFNGVLMKADLEFSLDALCQTLEAHIAAQPELPFDVKAVPTEEAYESQKAAMQAINAAKQQAQTKAKEPTKAPAAGKAEAPSPVSAPSAPDIAAKVADLISAEDLGALQHSCKPKLATESEAEYVVQVIKHMYINHVVLEFVTTNTLQDQVLEDVDIKFTIGDPSSWGELGRLGIEALPYDRPASAYVVLQKMHEGDDGLRTLLGTFQAALDYTVKEEGDDLGYRDTYPMENVTIAMGDYMVPRHLRPGEFKSMWESLQQADEAVSKFSLNFKTLESAATGLTTSLNMAPCDKSDKVDTTARGHTLLLSGTFIGGLQVLCKALIGLDQSYGCLLKLACRSKNPAASQAIVHSVE